MSGFSSSGVAAAATARSVNFIINPSGEIAQPGLASTADGAYSFDQWIVLTQSNPVTPSQVAAAEATTPFMMRLTQANAVAQRMGLIQWIEGRDCIELRSQSVVLSARVRMSVSTTLRYAIIEFNSTADGMTKDVVLDWTSATFTASNFFIASANNLIQATGSIALTANTLTDITALSATLSASVGNVAVFFWTDSTQAQNVTLDIGKVQLEKGTAATSFMRRPYAQELVLCQRFYEQSYAPGTAPGTATVANGLAVNPVPSNTVANSQQMGLNEFAVVKRSVPTIVIYGYGGTSGTVSNDAGTDLAAGSGGAFWIGQGRFCTMQTSGGPVTTSGFAVLFHWVANSRL